MTRTRNDHEANANMNAMLLRDPCDVLRRAAMHVRKRTHIDDTQRERMCRFVACDFLKRLAVFIEREPYRG